MKSKFVILIVLCSLLLGACASAASSPPTPTAGLDPAHPVTVRLALLTILDALPIYVAQDKGYIKAAGLPVEFVAANSAVERDQLMTAGQAEGMINDLVSLALYNRDTIQVQAVRFARVSAPGFPMYRIVASQQSGITDANGLRGVQIGISQGSVIDYISDRLLAAAGLSSQDIQTIAVPKMADRLSLLASGALKAATLPEPFATEAVKTGGKVILDDTSNLSLGNSVISFRKSFIDANPAAIQAFLRAVDQAVTDIAADPTAWSAVLTQYNLLPADLLASFRVPPFAADSLPTQAQFDDVVSWATAKQLISKPVDYSQVIYQVAK